MSVPTPVSTDSDCHNEPTLSGNATQWRCDQISLYALREQAGLSQQQLADRIGLSQRPYAYWERNPVALRPDQLLKLLEALHVSVDDLGGN
jgi:DNA-binding XRE family transcriptional regulator